MSRSRIVSVISIERSGDRSNTCTDDGHGTCRSINSSNGFFAAGVGHRDICWFGQLGSSEVLTKIDLIIGFGEGKCNVWWVVSFIELYFWELDKLVRTCADSYIEYELVINIFCPLWTLSRAKWNGWTGSKLSRDSFNNIFEVGIISND